MRHMDFPTKATARSQAKAASAMLCTRATLVAKQPTKIVFSHDFMTSIRFLATSASDPVLPSQNTLVESQTMAKTPSWPRARNLASSEVWPTRGSGSSFQSPVCSTDPAFVVIKTALGSGMEWVKVINSMVKGPMVQVPERGSFLMGGFCTTPSNFCRTSAAVKSVA